MDDPTTITKRLLADCNTPNTVEEIGFLASSAEDYEKALVGRICLQIRTHKYQLLRGSCLPAYLVAGAVVLCKHKKKKKTK
ncbi:hypothetical protein ACOSQ2_027897 [Xanthoceras sorbifolium]